MLLQAINNLCFKKQIENKNNRKQINNKIQYFCFIKSNVETTDQIYIIYFNYPDRVAWTNIADPDPYLYNIDPLKPHFYIVKLGFTGVYIIFLILAQKQIVGTH